MPPRNRRSPKDTGKGVKSRQQRDQGSGDVIRPQQGHQKNIQSKEKGEKKLSPNPTKSKSYVYTVRPCTAFIVLLAARICSAIWGNIFDCDETFNYWEPIHYLVKGTGFQTWEYSPTYAIRSYAYLWFYSLPALAYTHFFHLNKFLVFYLVRIFLAFFSALCETYFYRGVLRQFGSGVSRLVFIFLALSTGLFVSSTAVLPNTFSMYMILILLGAWLQQHNRIAILVMGLSTLVGWPFSAILCLPILFEMVSYRKQRNQVVKWILMWGTMILALIISIDSYYYGKIVIAPLNIILYNVFTSHGANLYGTELWTYYFTNSTLNFNVVFGACLLAPPLMALSKLSSAKVRRNLVTSRHWVCVVSLLLWFIILTCQAHKEERFFFPAYPFICLLAAFTVDFVQKFIQNSLPKVLPLYSILVLMFMSSYILISVSRTTALYKGYHAPIDTFLYLNQINTSDTSSPSEGINVCMGKDWHRFPSNFFLPDSKKWRLRFIQSEFRGQLPQPFQKGPLATRVIPPAMNNLNKEEPSRYIPVNQCHFLIDSDRPLVAEREPRYSAQKNSWEIIHSVKFLDAPASPPIWRSFYLPVFFYSKNSFVDFNLLRKKSFSL